MTILQSSRTTAQRVTHDAKPTSVLKQRWSLWQIAEKYLKGKQQISQIKRYNRHLSSKVKQSNVSNALVYVWINPACGVTEGRLQHTWSDTASLPWGIRCSRWPSHAKDAWQETHLPPYKQKTILFLCTTHLFNQVMKRYYINNWKYSKQGQDRVVKIIRPNLTLLCEVKEYMPGIREQPTTEEWFRFTIHSHPYQNYRSGAQDGITTAAEHHPHLQLNTSKKHWTPTHCVLHRPLGLSKLSFWRHRDAPKTLIYKWNMEVTSTAAKVED